MDDVATFFDNRSVPVVWAGTEFWAASLENKPGLNHPQELGVAVVPALPGTPTVTVYKLTGSSVVTVASGAIPSTGTLFTIAGPVMQGAGISEKGVYFIQSTGPIHAWQFNPLANVQSNDATPLIPQQSLGHDYLLTTMPGDLLPAYATIIATEDNTDLAVEYPVATLSVGTLAPGLAAPAPAHYTLHAFQALNLRSAPGGDFTGARIKADKPVAVFAGDVCTRIERGACDILVEQQWPRNSWDTEYPVCLPPLPTGKATLRILNHAAFPNRVTTIPSIGVVDLLPYGWADIPIDRNVVVEAVHPVSVNLAMHGDGSDEHQGDPSLAQITPKSWFAQKGHYYLPTGWTNAYVTIPSTGTGSMVIDNQLAAEPSRTTIEGTPYDCTTIPANTGAHSYGLNAQGLVGGQVFAWGTFGSLAYPAVLTPVVSPPTPKDAPDLPGVAAAATLLPPQNPQSSDPCNPGLPWPTSNAVGPTAPIIIDITSDADVFASPYYLGGIGSDQDPAVLHIPGCLQLFAQIKGINITVEFWDMAYHSTVSLTPADITTYGIPAHCTTKAFVFCAHGFGPWTGHLNIRDFYPGDDVAMVSAQNASVRFSQTPTLPPAMKGSVGQILAGGFVEIQGVTWTGIDAPTRVDGGRALVQASNLHTYASWCMAPLREALPAVNVPPMTRPPPLPLYDPNRGPVDNATTTLYGHPSGAWIGAAIDRLAANHEDALIHMTDRIAANRPDEAETGLDFVMFDLEDGAHLETDASNLGGAFIVVRTNQSKLDSSGSTYSCSGWGVVSEDSQVSSFTTRFVQTNVPYKLIGAVDSAHTAPNHRFSALGVSFDYTSSTPPKAFLSVCDVFQGTHPAVVISDNQVTVNGANFVDGFPVHASTSTHDAALYGGMGKVVPVPDNIRLNGAIHDPTGSGRGNCFGGPPLPSNPLPEVQVVPPAFGGGFGVPTPPDHPCELGSRVQAICDFANQTVEELPDRPIAEPCDQFTLNTFNETEFLDHHANCFSVQGTPCGYWAPGVGGGRPGYNNPGDPNYEDSNVEQLLADPEDQDQTVRDLTACGVCPPNSYDSLEPDFIVECLPVDPQCALNWAMLMASDASGFVGPSSVPALNAQAQRTFNDARTIPNCVHAPSPQMFNQTPTVSGPNQGGSHSGSGILSMAALGPALPACTFPVYCLLDGTGSQRYWMLPTSPPTYTGFAVQGLVNVPLVSADLRSVHYLVFIPTTLNGTTIEGGRFGFYNFEIKASPLNPVMATLGAFPGGFQPNTAQGGYGFATNVPGTPPLATPWARATVVPPPTGVGPLPCPSGGWYCLDPGALRVNPQNVTPAFLTFRYYWHEKSYPEVCVGDILPAQLGTRHAPCLSGTNVNALTACIAGNIDRPNSLVNPSVASTVDLVISRASVGCGTNGDGTHGGSHHFNVGKLNFEAQLEDRNPRRVMANMKNFDATNTAVVGLGLSHNVTDFRMFYSGGDQTDAANVTLVAQAVSPSTHHLSVAGKLNATMSVHYFTTPYVDSGPGGGLGLPCLSERFSPNVPIEAVVVNAVEVQNPVFCRANSKDQGFIGNLTFFLGTRTLLDASNTSVQISPLMGPMDFDEISRHDKNFTIHGFLRQPQDQWFRLSADMEGSKGPAVITGILRHLGADFELTAIGHSNGLPGARAAGDVSAFTSQGYFSHLRLDVAVEDAEVHATVLALSSIKATWGEAKGLIVDTPDDTQAYPLDHPTVRAYISWEDTGMVAFNLTNVSNKAHFEYTGTATQLALKSTLYQEKAYHVNAHYKDDLKNDYFHLRDLEFRPSPGTTKSQWQAHGEWPSGHMGLALQIEDGAIGNYEFDGRVHQPPGPPPSIGSQPTVKPPMTFAVKGYLLQGFDLSRTPNGVATGRVILPPDPALYDRDYVPLTIELDAGAGKFAVDANWTDIKGPKTLKFGWADATKTLSLEQYSYQAKPFNLALRVELDSAKGEYFNITRIEFYPDAAANSTFTVKGRFDESHVTLNSAPGWIGNYSLAATYPGGSFDGGGLYLAHADVHYEAPYQATIKTPLEKKAYHPSLPGRIRIGFNGELVANATLQNITGQHTIAVTYDDAGLKASDQANQTNAWNITATIKPDATKPAEDISMFVEIVPRRTGTSHLAIEYSKGALSDGFGLSMVQDDRTDRMGFPVSNGWIGRYRANGTLGGQFNATGQWLQSLSAEWTDETVDATVVLPNYNAPYQLGPAFLNATFDMDLAMAFEIRNITDTMTAVVHKDATPEADEASLLVTVDSVQLTPFLLDFAVRPTRDEPQDIVRLKGVEFLPQQDFPGSGNLAKLTIHPDDSLVFTELRGAIGNWSAEIELTSREPGKVTVVQGNLGGRYIKEFRLQGEETEGEDPHPLTVRYITPGTTYYTEGPARLAGSLSVWENGALAFGLSDASVILHSPGPVDLEVTKKSSEANSLVCMPGSSGSSSDPAHGPASVDVNMTYVLTDDAAANPPKWTFTIGELVRNCQPQFLLDVNVGDGAALTDYKIGYAQDDLEVNVTGKYLQRILASIGDNPLVTIRTPPTTGSGAVTRDSDSMLNVNVKKGGQKFLNITSVGLNRLSLDRNGATFKVLDFNMQCDRGDVELWIDIPWSPVNFILDVESPTPPAYELLGRISFLGIFARVEGDFEQDEGPRPLTARGRLILGEEADLPFLLFGTSSDGYQTADNTC